ncbi:MAG: YihA family ribosome biogenesis GTP-binding protein [Gammaproteobacteria bacterium RIFCSPHIGHO2_12_FULL_35_23]|nr:MAG: YihA family ribosome biogenesis GTP-binding protein [Gammaproteobacteria bacterium RIFCSPHIGHO2_12_FULL_35_23]
MNFSAAKFLISIANISQLPEDKGLEVAFAGRSNAGKSSVINVLTQQKNLARTSKTPGRTQLINLFALDENKRLVDLPGYGYAKVAGSLSRQWADLIDQYLTSRHCLQGVVLVMDIRHPLREIDLQMLNWANQSQLAIHLLLNKADKLNYGEQKKILLMVEQKIKLFNSTTVQLFSSHKINGLDELKQRLSDWYKD